MARTRNLKPGFFKNADLAALGPWAQLLFSGLWCIADREGRLKDDPRWIKAEILPYANSKVNVEQLLSELASSGDPAFIARYEHGGRRYISVTNFGKHQNPHVKEQASTIPAPDMSGASTGNAPYEPGLKPYTLNLKPSTSSSSSNGAPQPQFGGDYPLTIAEIRKHDPAVDDFFVAKLAQAVMQKALSNNDFPQEDLECISDKTIAAACHESYVTGPMKHSTGLLLSRVPSIVITWGVEK